jgi:hypothetical protein
MNAPTITKKKAGWRLPRLNQSRHISRLFLAGLLLLLFIGFAGVFHSGLAPIGAGQTELAYSVARLRNGASLVPIAKTPRFSLAATADALLQNYFSLDPDTGALVLRDGLRSLAIQTNPLKSFPVQIVKEVPNEDGKKTATSIYIHLLNCQQFLAMQAGSAGRVIPKAASLSDSDAVLRCIDIQPVLAQESTLAKVRAWIKNKSDKSGEKLLPTIKSDYLKSADEILKLPQPPQSPNSQPPKKSPKSPSNYSWGPFPAPLNSNDIPVWRIFILEERAEPGLQIFAAEQPPTRTISEPDHQPTDFRPVAPESGGGVLLRFLDRVFLLILQLRYPVLISLGILAPLLTWFLRQKDRVVRCCLEPYLLLLLAQVVSLFLADALMGEGLVIWVGFIYTLLRLLQLAELFWLSRSKDPRFCKRFNLRSRPWLRDLLRLQLVLWGINALGLGRHILGVFLSFPWISPA